MIPRPYQESLVNKMISALKKHGNSLAISATGSGKTIMMSMLLKELGGQQMILAHREELVAQNRQKFHLINQKRTSSIYGLGIKDISGQTIFGMTQTLGRNGAMDNIPPLDILVIDEAHRVVSESNIRIVEAAKDKNPNCMIAGFTATGTRGDKKGLKPVFDNVCDIISMQHLVNLGFLVPIRTFIATLPGLSEEIQKVSKDSTGEFDMSEVETLMDTIPVNDAVFREWQKLAGNRKTIVFCSTIRHAKDICHIFQSNGILADCVFGETPNRSDILQRFEHGDLQVVCNVSVLGEGYDSPPCSCIVLLRPCSFKSTLIQMIGRATRTIDPEIYPNIIKRDCIVLDFGESLRIHGDLEQGVQFDDAETGEAEQKECPQCHTLIPIQTRECPACGFKYAPGDRFGKEKEYADIVMMEVNLLKKSPFAWVDLFGSKKVMVCSGFDAWSVACTPNGNDWLALGKLKGEKVMKKLAIGSKIQSLAAADDFLRRHENNDTAKKSKRWLKDPPSIKQLELLGRITNEFKNDYGLTKYSVNCLLNFFWNKSQIEREVWQYANRL